MKVLRVHSNLKQIISLFKEWSQSSTKLIVAIDGYGGSGKTWLTDKLGEAQSMASVSLDDFVYEFDRRRRCVASSNDPSHDLAHCWFRSDEVISILKAFKRGDLSANMLPYDFDRHRTGSTKRIDLSPKILVVEGVFSIGQLGPSGLIDRRILILRDFEDADATRIEREKKRWGESYDDDDPESYAMLFRRAFDRYLSEGKAFVGVDLILIQDN